MEEKEELKVCVTGGSGNIASSLIHNLLLLGYTVHATLRNLTVRRRPLRRSSPPRLRRLQEAHLPTSSAPPASPSTIRTPSPPPSAPRRKKEKRDRSSTEAAVEAAKEIGRYCMKAKTVRRLIYTASVVSASPLSHEDVSSFNHFMDESCWTPLHHLPYLPYMKKDFVKNYTESKTKSEREILSYNERNKEGGGKLEVVSLVCGLVGGDTVMSSTPTTVKVFISQVKNSEIEFYILNFLEELIGNIPIVHIQDVCDAHIFCIQKPSLSGRFLVAASYVSSSDVVNYYLQSHPQFHINHKYLEGRSRRDIKWASTKLKDEGFEYKYDMKAILDDCISCATRMGDL